VLLFILGTAEIQQSLCCPTLLTLSNKLVTTLYDCLIDGTTINSVLDNPTIVFDFINLLVDSRVCRVM